MNNSEKLSVSNKSDEVEQNNLNRDSKLVKIVIWIGLSDILIGLLMGFFSDADQPMIFVSGILLVAVGIITVVIAKFSTWWKFG